MSVCFSVPKLHEPFTKKERKKKKKFNKSNKIQASIDNYSIRTTMARLSNILISTIVIKNHGCYSWKHQNI